MDIFTVDFSPPSPTPDQNSTSILTITPKEVFFEPHFDLNSSDMQAFPAGGDFPMTYTTNMAHESSPSPSSVPSSVFVPDQNELNEISAFDHEPDNLPTSPSHHSHTQVPSGTNSVKSTDSLLADDSDGSLPEQSIKERVPRKLASRPIEPLRGERSVLVIGREFDQPNQIAYTLEKRFGDIFHEHGVCIDSLPVPSHRLLSADPSRLLRRVYSCLLLCYNATEARLLVTSEGGYYSSLVPYALNSLGNNKVMLAFTHCQTDGDNLLASDLQNRILSQPHMQPMMNQFRSIFSWADTPSDVHIQRMFEIINESPVYMSTKKSCTII